MRMTGARRRACAPAGRPRPARCVHLRATSSRCQRRMVSGVTRVATCASSDRPRRCPNTARHRRSPSSKRRRRPASRAFRRRFSSQRYAITSACSPWSQPPNAAISNWNGNTPEVYATTTDPPVGHYALGAQDARDRRTADVVAQVLQRTLHARVAPCGVLGRHPNDERSEACLQARTAAMAGAIRPLARHQLAVPTQNGVRRHDGRDLREQPATEPVS